MSSNGKSVKTSERTFTLPVHKFQIRPNARPETWVILTLPFAEAITLLEARTYDILRNRGEQRELNIAWTRKLARDMAAGNYTPAGWSACFRKSHADDATFNEEEETVTFKVSPKIPLAHIDGNHRGRALLNLIESAKKVLDSPKSLAGDKDIAQEMIDLVNQCDITVQIYLDPKRVHDYFGNLQDGRPLSRDQKRVRAIRNKKGIPPEKQPVADMSLAVALRLGRNKDSHLDGRVALGESTTNLVSLNTLTSGSASEMSCSIFGGAEIAIHYGQKAEWLEQCYVEAWDVVEHMTSAPDGKESIPNVLLPDRILCPLGRYNGRKGGSTLIVGIGNMWAFYKAFIGRKEATAADKERLAACIDDVFDDHFPGGLGAPLKRSLMGRFARRLFEGIVLGEEEPEKPGKVAGKGGVPVPLLRLISESAFGIKKDRGGVSLPDEDLIEEFDDILPDGEKVAVGVQQV
jgi:hypothetical protein